MKKYKILYCDPPWRFKTYSEKGKEKKSAERHYKTMTKEDIQNLDISAICEDDCILFLWVTWPCLKEGLELIEKWGFTYKTDGFLWVKKNKVADSLFWGLGYWTRANTEPCLIATRGNPKRISKAVHQVIMSKVGKHSAKPDEARKRIVALCGDLPRIELFAREKVEKWDCWGNEVENSIEIHPKEKVVSNWTHSEWERTTINETVTHNTALQKAITELGPDGLKARKITYLYTKLHYLKT